MSCSATLGKSKITVRSSSAHILHAYLAINTFEIPSVFPLELLAIVRFPDTSEWNGLSKCITLMFDKHSQELFSTVSMVLSNIVPA